MYLIVSGALHVRSGQGERERELVRLEPGATFGEMALVEGRERSADVVSESHSEVLALSAEDLQRLERRFPRTALKLLHNLSTILSERLRAATTTLVKDAGPAVELP